MEKVRGSIVTLRDGEPVESQVTEDADFCAVITMNDNPDTIRIGIHVNGLANKYMVTFGIADCIAELISQLEIKNSLTREEISAVLQRVMEKLDRKTE